MLKGGVGRSGLGLPFVGGTGRRDVSGYIKPDIVTDRLQFFVNAADPDSYPGSGDIWFDLSGNGFHLTKDNLGGVGICNWNSDGYFQFSGGANFETQNANIPLANACTLLAWYNQVNAGLGSPRILETLVFGVTSPIASHAIVPDPDGSVRGWFDTDGTTQNRFFSLDTTTTYPNNEWRMLTLTYDGSTAKLYINDVVVLSTATTSQVLDDINVIILAAVSDYNNIELHTAHYFNGNIATAMIYDKALSLNEVNQNFNALRGRFDV